MALQVAIGGTGRWCPPPQGGLLAAGVRSLSAATTMSWDPGHDLGGNADGKVGAQGEGQETDIYLASFLCPAWGWLVLVIRIKSLLP